MLTEGFPSVCLLRHLNIFHILHAHDAQAIQLCMHPARGMLRHTFSRSGDMDHSSLAPSLACVREDIPSKDHPHSGRDKGTLAVGTSLQSFQWQSRCTQRPRRNMITLSIRGGGSSREADGADRNHRALNSRA